MDSRPQNLVALIKSQSKTTKWTDSARTFKHGSQKMTTISQSVSPTNLQVKTSESRGKFIPTGNSAASDQLNSARYPQQSSAR